MSVPRNNNSVPITHHHSAVPILWENSINGAEVHLPAYGMLHCTLIVQEKKGRGVGKKSILPLYPLHNTLAF